MARTSVQQIRESGYTLTVYAEHDDFASFTEEILADMRTAAEPRMHRALEHVVQAVKWTLSAVYPAKSKSGEERQPSPPGAPPGMVLGELQDSWRKKGAVGWVKKGTVLRGRYFSRSKYAGPLEFGSPKQGIPSRPYIRPTLIREADAIDRILSGADE